MGRGRPGRARGPSHHASWERQIPVADSLLIYLIPLRPARPSGPTGPPAAHYDPGPRNRRVTPTVQLRKSHDWTRTPGAFDWPHTPGPTRKSRGRTESRCAKESFALRPRQPAAESDPGCTPPRRSGPVGRPHFPQAWVGLWACNNASCYLGLRQSIQA
jgi:hypothetical protein